MRLSNPIAAATSILAFGITIATASPIDNNPSSSYPDGPTIQEINEYHLDPKGYSPHRKHAEYGDHLDDHITPAKRDPRGWVDPAEHGGSLLDLVNNGLREPINTIISGNSDPYILTDRGLRDYVRSIGFSFECLDLHMGDLQRANLGDGTGWQEEMFEYRSTQGFGAPGRWVGACWESWNGGDHFRVWKQNGTVVNSGAWFLAVSNEKNLRHRHTIAPRGYDQGRNDLVAAAMQGGNFRDKLWKADVEWVEGMLPAGSDGINHGIEIDGMVAVLTVQRHYTVPFAPKGWSLKVILDTLQQTTDQITSTSIQNIKRILQWITTR